MNCGAPLNVQAVSYSPPQSQAQNRAQFSPHQQMQAPPQQSLRLQQFDQPQMPPAMPQKPDRLHNLLIACFVFGVFALAIGFIVWGAVFDASGAAKVIPILIVSAGLLITVINAASVARKIWRINRSAKTKGVVMNVEISLGMQQSDSFTRNTLFTPTLRFRTADGRIVDYTPKIRTIWHNYSVGENVPVYYNPQRPEKAIIGRFYNLWFPHFLSGFVGGMFLFGGAIAILVNF